MSTILPLLTTFLLPIYLIKIHLTPNISINLLEILLILSMIAIYTNILQVFTWSKIKFLLRKNKNIFLPIFLIILGFLISYFYNQQQTHWSNWSDGLGKLMDLIILPIIFATGVHFLAIINLKDLDFNINKKVHPFIRLLNFIPIGMVINIVYYFSAGLVAFLGLIFLLTGHLTFDHRLQIFFNSPNQLAMFLAPGLIIGTSFLFTQFNQSAFNSFRKFWLLYLSILAIILNIYFTKSLGSWLSLFFIILLLASYYNIATNKILKTFSKIFQRYSLLIVIGAIIISTLSILNINFLLTKLNHHPQIPPTSNDSRLTTYQVTQKIISNNWFLGIGPGNFQKIYLQEQKNFPTYPQWAIPHAHNNLLHFWSEGGFLAFLGLILIYLNILKVDPQRRVSSDNLKQKKTSLPQLPFPQLVLLYFILHGLVDTTIWTPPTAIFFWFTVVYYLTKQDI